MTEAFALKPCPFCGTPGKWFKTGRDVGIECGDESNCPGNAQTDTYDPEHKELAVNAWNKRVTVSEKGAVDVDAAFDEYFKDGGYQYGDAALANARGWFRAGFHAAKSVSEKGDADELLREVLDWGLPDDLKQRIDAHLSRKEQ